ncbi:MAG: fibronectin type III domain-containing protein [Thermodesulfovibrionales bacterium]
MMQNRRVAAFFLACLTLGLCLSLSACGKKGEPTLKSFEKPPAPAQLRAIHRENELILQWDYPRGQEAQLADFVLYKSSGAEFEKLVNIERSNRSYGDREIRQGTTYQYKLIAQNYRGVYSTESNTLTAAPGNVPAAPHSLSYTIRDNTVVIGWDHPAAGATFNVYRSFEKDKFGMTPVNDAPLAESVFTDTLNTVRPVYYVVRSLAGGPLRGEGPASPVLAVDPADLVPGKPQKIQALAGEDKVFLSWEAPPEPWLKGFRIYRRMRGEEYIAIGETQIPTFTDSTDTKTRRDYRVHALGPVNEGPGVEVLAVSYTPQR